jgi:predicted O-methyltransferase YrrM
MRLLANGEDALAMPMSPETGLQSDYDDLNLAFADAELGVWSLGSASLDFLVERIRALKPRAVLEFGSGISTAVLARALRELHGDVATTALVSLEQDLLEADRTTKTLARLGLDRIATVVHSPLRAEVVGGRTVSAYDSDPEALARLTGRSFDLLVIDGPSAEPGSRVATLLNHRSLLSHGAVAIMDDAMRDGELWAGTVWGQEPNIDIDGVLLVDKGLMIARSNGPAD